MPSGTPLHPIRSTHDEKHVDSLEKFGSDLQAALNDVFPTQAKPYIKVHMELFYWDNNHLEKNNTMNDDVDAIRELFEKKYHYDIEEFEIPSKDDKAADK